MKQAYRIHFNQITKLTAKIEKLFKLINKCEKAYNKLKEKEPNAKTDEEKEKLKSQAEALKEQLDNYIDKSKKLISDINSRVAKIKKLPHYNLKELKQLKARFKFIEIEES